MKPGRTFRRVGLDVMTSDGLTVARCLRAERADEVAATMNRLQAEFEAKRAAAVAASTPRA